MKKKSKETNFFEDIQKIKNFKDIKVFLKKYKKIIILIMFLLMVILSFVMLPANFDKPKNGTVSKKQILSLFDKIKNNYSLSIEENINGKLKILEYSNDSNVILYEGSLLDKDGYLFYDNKLFSLDLETKKLKKEREIPKFVNDVFYDIDLIKKVVNHCEFEYINPVKTKCNIKIKDYINEYNLKYNKSIINTSEEDMNFEIVYYSDGIGKINIDYTKINKIINNNEDNIFYGIKISNVDKNDFSEIIKNYNDVIHE